MTDLRPGTAVELFDEWHDRGAAGGESRYRTLLPATGPGPGEQYRFEVDLDRCTGCKACVSACHSLNGLDEAEAWRSVGLLVGGGAPVAPWQQHVTTACHHCIEPACLAGCPVDAYEKDPVTGIVAHLDDQCIGCRYCMLTCPYEVPTFNGRLGVVRKCDMCSDRLADGEAPACVQGCPTEAISIGVVNTAELQAGLATDPDGRLVPTAPRSALSSPTTVYLTTKPMPIDAIAADDHRVDPAGNHPPLVAMLVLTQLSVGAFVLLQVLERAGIAAGGAVSSFVAWATALVALGASVLHLGRPLVAWRAVLGLGHSWLSREIVAFGAYAATGGATAAAALGALPRAWEPGLAGLTALIGVAGVTCSAFLYAVTGRALWRLDRIAARFGWTTLASGAAAVGLTTSIASEPRTGAPMAWVVRACAGAALAATMVFVARHRRDSGSLGRSVRLMRGPLRDRMVAAILAVAVAVVPALVVAVAHPSRAGAVVCWSIASVSITTAAWLERGLFFTASAPDRMPGAFR